MTTDGLLGERPHASASPLPVPQILDLCDRIVGEIGRRAHIFGWLRGADDESWLTVDAYYPANRLVVICRERPTDTDELIAERVPQHGLRLLTLAPDELADDPAGVDAALRRRLDALGRREAAPQMRLPPPAVPSYRKPPRPSRPQAIRRAPTGVAAPPARHHPLAAALLIAALFTVFVIAVAIVTTAHG